MAAKTLRISDKEAYRVLGLPLGVDKEAITKKYKSLSLKLSAGKTQEDKKRLELVTAAYNCLLPPEHHNNNNNKMRPNQKGHSGSCNDVTIRGSREEDDGGPFCNGDVSSALSKDPADMTEEEKERRRAEKKRAKKKRQKEKKKMEKSEPQTVSPKPVFNNHKREESPSEEEEEDEEEEEEEEDEEEGEGQGIDPNSAFVAAAAAKRGVLGGAVAKERPPRQPTHPPAPPHHHHQYPRTPANNNNIRDGNVLEAAVPDAARVKACQLAKRGNEAASVGSYVAAVKLFSDAIALDPRDYRFLGNRSYCLNQLGNHEQALQDAEQAVLLAPEWAKGHYRRGTALKDLGRYVEAERAFEDVLRLDLECQEAQEEVVRVRAARLMEMGFTERQAVSAVAKYSSVQLALDALLAGEFKESFEESFHFVGNTDNAARKPGVTQPRDFKMNPLNPEGLTSLWVGNVVPEVTEKGLTQLFASQGQVKSVRLLQEKYCAFVNYADKEAAGRAMAKLQGHVFGGQKLLIKFPDNPITGGPHKAVGGMGYSAINPQQGTRGGQGYEGYCPPSSALSSTGSSRASSSSTSSSSSSSPSPLLMSPSVFSSTHKKWV